jgi:hypothetical protein
MSKIEHTPGPWEAYHVSSAGWSVRMAQPREGFDSPDPICSMAWWQFDKPGIIDSDISGANARLIAAAPELLAACKSFIDMWHRAGPLGSHQFEKFDSVVKQCSMAIKKATGDQ